jgi:predicted RNA-binding protein (virulence factor B family)
MSYSESTDLTVGYIVDATVEEVLPTGYWLLFSDQRLFLPIDNTSHSLAEKQNINVLVTHDKSGQIVADARLPSSALNEAVLLTAKDATDRGAFFNWGTTRDLYVPAKWQESPINPGMDYVVVPLIDEKTGKITGCTKLKHCFPESNKWLKVKQTVNLQVFAKTQLGYKILINGDTIGLLFHSDVHVTLHIGETLEGSIKSIREDGKIDLSIAQQSSKERKTLEEAIIEDLLEHDGLSTLTDKSAPDEIFERFKVSKGAYKKALGSLFKKKKIVIDKDAVRISK